MNKGKKFENNFIKSLPDWIFYYRLRDAWWWSNWTNTRFTISNIADFIVFNWQRLYILELKTTKGKSLPLWNIKDSQIQWMLKASEYDNVEPYIIINYSEHNITYMIHIWNIVEFIKKEERKSIPINRAECFWIEIEWTKLRTNYRYDLTVFNKKV